MWLDRFERVDGQLMTVGITQSGSQSLLTPEKMQTSSLGTGAFKAITLNTSFSQWERISAREYAKAFGITSSVTDCHGAFSIPHEGGNIVFPAWELQRTLLGAPATIANYVYRPGGLELLCSPVCTSNNFTIALPVGRELGRRQRSDVLTERLTWFYAYPSAYRAWNSIYRHACSGRIDIDLPSADAQISAHGRIIDGVFYARRIYVLKLVPLEPPLDWAKTDREAYHFVNGLMQYIKSRQTGDPRLRPIGHRWTLTDDEWMVVQKIVFSRTLPSQHGRPWKHDVREAVDGIIVKMGTGMSWAGLDNSRVKVYVSSHLYKRMKADGRWDHIAEFLASSRRKQ
jgi:hypothetical protein